MKKFAAVSIILSMILVNASCGKGQEKPEASMEVTVTQTMYKEQRLTLPDDLISFQDLSYSESNGVRLVYKSIDGAIKFVGFNEKMEYNAPTELVFERKADEVIVNLESDGSFTVLCQYKDVENAKAEFEIRCYNADGEFSKSMKISGMERYFTVGESFVSGIVRYGNDYILPFSGGTALLDENGSVTDVSDSDNDFFYGEDSEGNMIVSSMNGYAVLDGKSVETPQEMIPYGGYLSRKGGHVRGTGDYKLYFMMIDGIFGLTKSDELVKITDYIASDVSSSELIQIAPAGEGKFVATGRDYKTRESYLSLLTVRPDDYVQNKETVVVGVSGNVNSDKRELSVEFNKYSDNYSVEMKAYDDSDEKLKEDVLSGNAPDVYCYTNTGTMYRYANMGAFADMWELSAEYGGFSKDDILDNIVQAYEYKGGLYGISDRFSANFLLANNDIIGEEYSDWNYDEFLSIAENMPEEMYLGVEMECNTQEDVFELYCLNNLSSWIDYERAVCSFDSDEFIKLLDFVKTAKIAEPFDWTEYKNTHTEDEANSLYREAKNAVKNKKALLANYNLSGLANLNYIAEMYGFKDGEATFLNYPSENRSGVVSPCYQGVYSVLRGGKCTAGGWAFVDYIMSFDNQADKSAASSSRRFSTRKDAFEHNLLHDQRISQNPDVIIDGEEWHNFEFINCGAVSDETIDSIKELVGRCSVLAGSDKPVEDIMREEFLEFISDEITAEECAERIQNRAEIYLSETS